MKVLRCAVYTRKSTEDGLEQEFNSLDAQREACEAYILSQKHEGWTLVPDQYDDGGYSGGNMERPGLKALLAEVTAGKIDIIVVYKVDRLTRSLADFAKIVEQLDAREASFVSVTQAFNTTTSMGRLTLNVLLSFAQFEREVTGERIRDKIAAAKKKGLWMGGPVPLGYQVVDRKLVPQPEEAQRVRDIMQRYLNSPSAPALLEELRREGIKTKIQNRTSGPHKGGIYFQRGSLFYLLKNPVYRGKIVHQRSIYDGEHEPIIEETLWNAVQAKLAAKAPPRKRPTNSVQDGLLRGLLSDPDGRPMVPSFTCKGARRYHYYMTRNDLVKPGQLKHRLSMHAFDQYIIEQLIALLSDAHRLRRMSQVEDADTLRSLFRAANQFREQLQDRHKSGQAITQLIGSIRATTAHLEITLLADAFLQGAKEDWVWIVPNPPKRPFREAKVRINGASESSSNFNASLVELLREARTVQELVLASPELSMLQLSKREGRCRKQIAKLLRVSWLSPRIVEAIIEGRQPQHITRRLLLDTELPLEWDAQSRVLGIAH